MCTMTPHRFFLDTPFNAYFENPQSYLRINGSIYWTLSPPIKKTGKDSLNLLFFLSNLAVQKDAHVDVLYCKIPGLVLPKLLTNFLRSFFWYRLWNWDILSVSFEVNMPYC